MADAAEFAMTSCILALDQGTTSSRAILFDTNGDIVAMAQQEFTQHFPQPGWVEHDANEIWRSQLAVARAAIAQSGVSPQQIAAIGITNQRETTVLWDRVSGEPVAPAIVWQDRRTAPLCDELRAAGQEARIQEKTGLLLDAYFSASKLKWLLDHVPGARARALNGELAFGTIDSWLVWNLSAGHLHVTDASNASRTLLYDIHKQCWDSDLLRLFDIPAALLPEVRSSSEVYGLSAPELFSTPIPIAGIVGDQQAATFGQACLEPGMAKNTYGTGCFLLLNTGGKAVASRNMLLTTVAWRLGGETVYALEGSVFMGGAVVQWLRDGLGIIDASAQVETLAASVADAGGVYMVPAFTGLGAPWWEGHARGALFGMTRGSGRGHIARAALEAIAYQSADVLAAMQEDAGVSLRELRVDGGATRNNLLMQFQADILDVPVVRPQVTETTALGAAYLAGLAVGIWRAPADVAAHWRIERRFEPAMAQSQREQLLEGWHRAVRHAIAWARDRTSATQPATPAE
jgi:glycerol kinase